MLYKYNRVPEGIKVPKGSVLLDPEGKYRKAHFIIKGVEKKHCGYCEKWKPLSDFYVYKKHWDGLDSYCKKCNRKLQEASYGK